MQIKCVLICRECRLVSLWCVVKGSATAAVAVVFKKNLNAAKPPEQSKGLGGKIGCKVCSALKWRL